MSTTPRLLAVDLDGTLVRRDGAIDERDRRAIAALRDRGITIVVATGRLYAGARAVIEELELMGTQICADGAHLVQHPTGRDVSVTGLASVVGAIRDVLAGDELALFALSRDRVLVDARSMTLNRYVRHIAPNVEQIDHVLTHGSWDSEPGPSALVAIGPLAGVDVLEPRLRALEVDVLRYDVPGGLGVSSLALHPRGASKGAAMETVAAELGIALDETVAVGDWLNDISMLERAGRSFAMAQAPAVVVEAAQHRLEASGLDGGGIAEVARTVWQVEV